MTIYQKLNWIFLLTSLLSISEFLFVHICLRPKIEISLKVQCNCKFKDRCKVSAVCTLHFIDKIFTSLINHVSYYYSMGYVNSLH